MIEIWKQTDSDNTEVKTEEILTKVKSMYALGYITDDNPSQINGCTGLSQVLLYSLPIDDELDLLEYEEGIHDFAEEMEDVHFGTVDIPRGSFLERISVIKLAQAVIGSILTDDNHSGWNKFSGLEQAICYEFGPIPLNRISEIKEKIKSMMPEILGGVRGRERYRPKDSKAVY